jgi:hypothetical protein
MGEGSRVPYRAVFIPYKRPAFVLNIFLRKRGFFINCKMALPEASGPILR